METSDSFSAVEEMTSPLPPKRPRTEHTEADNGKNRFEFPELLAFRERDLITQQSTSQAFVEPLPVATTNTHDILMQTINTDSTTQAETPQSSITDITETDRLILNMLYDSESALSVSHSAADTSRPDGSRLGKSVQCEPPVELSATGGDVGDGARQVQNSGSLIQPVTLTLAEEDVRCQADCSYEEAARDESTDMQNGALAASEESNQGEIQCEFTEKSPCNTKIEELKNSLSFSHFAGGKSFSAKPAVCPSSSLAEVGENNGVTLELQNVASCDGKTEARFDEGRELSFSGAGAVGAVTENMNTLYAKEREATEQAEEESIAKVHIETADAAETSKSISQIVSEGDNDAVSFAVIDPAIWKEADRPVEENLYPGFELPAKVCKNEGNPTLDAALQGRIDKLPEPEQTGQLLFQRQEQQQCEKGCLSNTEAVTSITHDQTGDKSDIENHRRPTSPCSSSSATSHSAEDQRGGSQGTVGSELKDTDQSGCFSGSLDHPEAPTQGDAAKKDKKGQIQVMEVTSMNCTNGSWLEEVMQQENIQKETIEKVDCITGNRFARHTDCKEKITQTAVERGDVKEKENEQEKTSEASELCVADLAEVQIAACNMLKAETSGLLDSGENEEKVDESEEARIVSQMESKMKEIVNNQTNSDASSAIYLEESQSQNVKNVTFPGETPLHNADIANANHLSEEFYASVFKLMEEENIAEETEVQIAACNMLKAETSGLVDSRENEEKVDESEQARIVSQMETELRKIENNQTNSGASSAIDLEESQSENVKNADPFPAETPLHNEDIANTNHLSDEFYVSVFNSLKQMEEESTDEETETEVKIAYCNMLKEEASGSLDSTEIKEKVDETEQAPIVSQMETELRNIENNQTNSDALSEIDLEENLSENVKNANTFPAEIANANHLDEFYLSVFNSLKQMEEESIAEETVSPTILASKKHVSITFPASIDAVVPGKNNLTAKSQCTDQIPAAPHNCNVRFSPTPSALPFTIRASAGGFDTFEKIQLSPDDNDIDASGPGNDPLRTSPPRQLLEKPSTHESESIDEDMSNVSTNQYQCLSSNSAHNVVASPVATADVIACGWPDRKPHCESTFQIYDCFLDSTAVSIESDSSECEGCDKREFEMKKQFDMVLKELKLFFDISASDTASSNGASSPDPLRDIIEALDEEASKCKEQEESVEEPDTRDTSLDGADDDHSLECEAVGSCAKNREGEQEVPLGNYKHQEAPRCSELKDTEPAEREQRQRVWSPSFMSLPLMEQLTQKLLEPQRRLEPLRTCAKPIRVGLSKRAKTGHLHHSHPYK